MSLGQMDPYLVEEFSSGTDKTGRPDDSNVSERDYHVLLPPRFLGYSTQEKFGANLRLTEQIRSRKLIPPNLRTNSNWIQTTKK